MTREEIFSLARQMVGTLRNGLARAAHYLRACGIAFESALAVLCGWKAA
jgi:hypothetical protein